MLKRPFVVLLCLALALSLGLVACKSTPVGSAGVSWPSFSMTQTRLPPIEFDLSFPDRGGTNESTALSAWVGCGPRPDTPEEAKESGEQILEGHDVTFDEGGKAGAIKIDARWDLASCDGGEAWVVWCTDDGKCYWGEFNTHKTERVLLFSY